MFQGSFLMDNIYRKISKFNEEKPAEMTLIGIKKKNDLKF
jgi:hypothetical protein